VEAALRREVAAWRRKRDARYASWLASEKQQNGGGSGGGAEEADDDDAAAHAAALAAAKQEFRFAPFRLSVVFGEVALKYNGRFQLALQVGTLCQLYMY
jgi:hypothetical protein